VGDKPGTLLLAVNMM